MDRSGFFQNMASYGIIEKFWEFARMEEGLDALEKGSVKALGHAIVLWGVMDGESTHRSGTSQVVCELVTHVFSSLIHDQAFYIGLLLGFSPGLEVSVRAESLVFGT
jgi:hypothetical protein